MKIIKRLFRFKLPKSKKGIFFRSIIILENTPQLETVKEHDFIKIVHNSNPYWAIFKCPCGCSSVITISLQNVHNPHWTVMDSKNGRPSVFPSIRRIKGCKSHFWIEDGVVYFC